MTEKRVQLSNVVKNQLPEYVREEFPLISEFLSQYYISQEYQGASADLIQNIDRYIKLNDNTNFKQSVKLNGNISFSDTTINIDADSGTTDDFPDSYGLLKINSEIITYKSKNKYSFLECIRGFSGITSYKKIGDPESLVFESSISQEHNTGDDIQNLSILFLKEFLSKIKKQFLPGFDERTLATKKVQRFPGGPSDDFPLNQNIFIKQSKDFYSSKGTDQSFKILFLALYGENVEVIKPREFLFRPSDAGYRVTNNLVVESVFGNPFELENLTLRQDTYSNITKAFAPVTKVEQVNTGIVDINYYEISLDSGYDRDIVVDGAIYGKFSVHPKTKTIDQVSIGQTYIDVDSTLGFPLSGELSVIYPNGESGVIGYDSKTFTQFLNCSGITATIPDNSLIDINTFAYAYVGIGTSNLIKVKIRSVLNSLNINYDSYYHSVGEKIKIKTLGVNLKDILSNNWYFNTSPTFEVKDISAQLPRTYRITLFDSHTFRIGDLITIKSSDGSIFNFSIENILSDKVFDCDGDNIINLNSKFILKRNRIKAVSTKHNINEISANVQNVYKLQNKILVSSPSIPYYSKPINTRILTYTLNGTFLEGEIFKITPNSDHGFYTGDAVYYTPEKDGDTVLSSLFEEGIYYVKRINQNDIKLSRSRSNIFNEIYVRLSSDKNVVNNKLELLYFKGKSLANQKLLREISPPINDGNLYPTNPGQTGILINGVEILNYKSIDSIYYGNIENINVVAGGEEYDIINLPQLIIRDSIGIGATGYVAVKGNLKEIKIINQGFDYLETPTIKISGGNGRDATAEAILTDTLHEVTFSAEEKSAVVNISNNTIGFTTYHKFRNNELLIYKTFSQKAISGLSTDSSYYVSVQNPTTIKLHKTFNDSVLGINTISLISYGKGNHTFEAYNKKKIVSSISVLNSGSGYENKKRTCSPVGIITSLDVIRIVDHDYKSGELLTYSVDGSAASGISTTSQYYVTTIDKDSFKLSNVGLTTNNQTFFYDTKQYVNITSIGIGTHIFNYPEISVNVIGNIGISSVSTEEFKCKIQPIFQGQITSVHLTNRGIQYGSSDIINYKREPEIEVTSGSGAILYPIVVEGKIVEVLINDGGNSYTSPPKLIVDGNGSGSLLTAILTNDKVTSVKIVSSGVGYNQNLTNIKVVSPGSGVKFISNIKSWNINLFKKYFDILNDDDGIVYTSINRNYGLEYCHLYAPRELRKTSYSTDSSGISKYLETDLQQLDGVGREIDSLNHSPIIGWAYDGNPIYGPYAYISKKGGSVVRMKSGYILSLDSNRPPLPPEFFVEDFKYFPSDDETVLDENNGRFCKTPDFPNGTYAYFATFETALESGGIFNGFRKPKFPFLIGKNYVSKPNLFNFNPNSNQDEYDLNDNTWLRNSHSYNLNEKNSYYEYLIFPNKLKEHISEVKTIDVGSIESVGVVTGGIDYKVGDELILDVTNIGSGGFKSKVSKISGKGVNSVSVSSTSITNIEFYPVGGSGNFIGFSSLPHGLNNFDLIEISGLSTSSSFMEGFYKIGISTNNLLLSGIGTTTLGISSTGVTGIVTYISIKGSLLYPNIRENDILQIGQEKVKVLNIDTLSSRIRILREIDGTVGFSHTAGTPIYEISRKFNVNVGYRTSFSNLKNREIYFNPSESLGLGTISGVGIGTTIIFSNPGAGITEIFIPTKTLYIENHNLQTGDNLLYNSNGGSTIQTFTTGIGTTSVINNTIFYVAKITSDLIGISTIKVGIGTTGTIVGIASTTQNISTLYFSGIGTGFYHSFKVNYPEILTGRIDKNLVTVSTAETHGLSSNDFVTIEVNPKISKTFIVKYNDYNRRITIGSKSFLAADVNITTNTITIIRHDLLEGQKIIHTANSPSGGLENNKIYYINVVDKDNIRLSNTFYDSTNSKPSFINLSSSSDGTLSLINPQLNAYKNSTLIFDLSDSSLSHNQDTSSVSSFDFDLFVSSNFNKKYEKIENNSLTIQKKGIIGVSTNAQVLVNINEKTPQLLYYKLNPTNLLSIPETKKEIVIDNEVFENNSIFIKNSFYNGNYEILVSTGNTFTYNLEKYPEEISYTSENSEINYITDSVNVSGPINSVDIISGGYNFDVLPGISSIITNNGSGAILNLQSSSIGAIKSTRIKNIGFDYPTDFTMRPTFRIPKILKLEPLSSFDNVGITSSGIGYVVAPKLIVIDGKTKNRINDVDLRYNVSDNSVSILKNTKGIFEVIPTILPIQNCNGIGISSISYNSTTKDVTLTLSVGFTTVSGFPFSINEKIIVEGISVSSGSTAKGYNSENYNYELFTVKNINPNYGGLTANIVYNLSGFLSEGEDPGIFDPVESSGIVVPEKYFPIFNLKLKKNIFYLGEEVTTLSSNSLGKIFRLDPITEYVIIETTDDFEEGQILLGKSSDAQALIKESQGFEFDYKLDSFSKVYGGWSYDAGLINETSQRIQDSFYYQNFSYSLKSKVDYDDWNDAVSNLNHTPGFKKFSDYQLESNSLNTNSLVVGSTDIDLKLDLVGVVDLNCVYNFDLVSENALNINSNIVSDEIIFNSVILKDYNESIGNRVLLFDDISNQFNSNPRSTQYAIIHRVATSYARTQKYIIFTRDARYPDEKQLTVATFLIDNDNFTYLNQYGVEGQDDLGDFDVAIDGSDVILQFYPHKFSVNDYDITSISYNIKDSLTSVGSSDFGCVSIATSSILVSTGSTTTIVGIATTYISSKILVEIGTPNGLFQYDELNLIHNGSDVKLLEFGKINNISNEEYVGSGLGTYNAYISGSQINLDFAPNPGIAATVNLIRVSIGDTSSTGIGTYQMRHVLIRGSSTSIASSTSPTSNIIETYDQTYDAAYFIVQVSDITNNNHQMSEVLVIDNETYSQTYQTEYAIVETASGLGTVGSAHSTFTNLTFTPNPNIDVVVKVYMNAFKYDETLLPDQINFNNAIVETDFSEYFGTETEIKREFGLTYETYPVFVRDFLGNNSSIVDITKNTIKLPNHFFVTGEKLTYTYAGVGSTQAIGIATTSVTGVGITDKLPSTVYVVKNDDKTIRLSESAINALKPNPITFDITHVGIGTSHTLIAHNQNNKVLITLDNNIQSPIVSTSQTTTLAKEANSIDDIIYFTGITSFFGGDLIKIGNEIIRIDGVGIGSTNAIRVKRSWLGTNYAGYSTGSLVTKVTGNYNIIGNTLNFVSAPYGNIPLSTSTNSPDERDWLGISTNSKFHGRMFMRSGEPNNSNETYYRNYIFDDISDSFTGITSTFTLKSSGSDISGISTNNAIILINEIFQAPLVINGISDDYILSESLGKTNISFVGSAQTIGNDIGISSFPRGGMIVSVGSTSGFGYQPLISAGGTSIISVAGTVQSISIGNTGSGYRTSPSYEIVTDTSYPVGIGSTTIYLENSNSVFSILSLLNTGSNCSIGVGTFIGIGGVITSIGSTFIRIGTASTSQYAIPSGTQAVVKISNPQIGIVNIGVANSSTGIATITHVGYSTIISGRISTSVTITNPGSGYTTKNSPFVIIDDPNSYSNIPLIYSSPSSGFGTGAKIDIVVGQGSSIIDFEIQSTGYGYGQGQILTLPIGGLSGIPTTSSYIPFKITIEKTINDKFSGWSLGELQVLDNFDSLFNGKRRVFSLKLAGEAISILSGPGSNIKVEYTLLVFINNILQVPGEGYSFKGGANIIFTEAPKEGDTSNIIFYRGSGDIDVLKREVLSTVKAGDNLTIEYSASLGQSPIIQEEERIVIDVPNVNVVSTNSYYGPGNVDNPDLLRPVNWCRQVEDVFINSKIVGKSRDIYEASINPSAYLIKSVGAGDTEVYVDNIRPFFNPINELNPSGLSPALDHLSFQKNIFIISQDSKVSASATAIVSSAGTISSIIINDGGVGYTTTPTVSIAEISGVGIGTTFTAQSLAIVSNSSVISIAITNPGFGYTSSNPPIVLIESPKIVFEHNKILSYEGDFGIVSGISSISVGIASTGIVFDLLISKDSFLRGSNIAGITSVSGITTVSGIQTGYYFIVYNSNVGNGVTSLDSNGSVVGIGTSYLDNVYEVSSVSIAQTHAVGFGLTYVAKVVVSLSNYNSLSGFGFSSFYGEYSWGRLLFDNRSESNTSKEYNAYTKNGVTGIKTGSILNRKNPLKYSNYII